MLSESAAHKNLVFQQDLTEAVNSFCPLAAAWGTIGDCMGVVWIVVVHLPNKRGWFIDGREVMLCNMNSHSCTQRREDPEAKTELGLPLFVAESYHNLNVQNHSYTQNYCGAWFWGCSVCLKSCPLTLFVAQAQILGCSCTLCLSWVLHFRGFTFRLVLTHQSEMLRLLLDVSENWASEYLSVDSCLLTLICLVSICSYCIATSRL